MTRVDPLESALFTPTTDLAGPGSDIFTKNEKKFPENKERTEKLKALLKSKLTGLAEVRAGEILRSIGKTREGVSKFVQIAPDATGPQAYEVFERVLNGVNTDLDGFVDDVLEDNDDGSTEEVELVNSILANPKVQRGLNGICSEWILNTI